MKTIRSTKVKKVKCKECNNMNKYGWCMMKKRCYTEAERNMERQCKYYFIRKRRKQKIKY